MPRWQIIVSKLTVATGVTTVTAAVPLAVGGVLADSARLGLGLAATALAIDRLRSFSLAGETS